MNKITTRLSVLLLVIALMVSSFGPFGVFKSYAEDGQEAQTEAAAEPQAESAPAPAAESAPAPAAEPAPAPAAEPASEPAASPAPAADADEAAPSEDAAPAEELAEEEPAETEEEAVTEPSAEDTTAASEAEDEEATETATEETTAAANAVAAAPRMMMRSAALRLGAPNDTNSNDDSDAASSEDEEVNHDVYVDGENGSDDNDGKSKGTAVKTWEKVKEIIGDIGDVFVAGIVKVKGLISLEGNHTVYREKDYKGVMFDVDGSATFKDIVVDGEGTFDDNGKPNGRQATGSAISVGSGETLNIYSGAEFKNLHRNGDGGVIYLSNGTLFVDGGTFTNNYSSGFGGVIYGSGSTNTTIRSGIFRYNRAYKGAFYYNSSSGNKLSLYNAVISNNTSKGTSYGNGGAGGVNVCRQGDILSLSVDGAAIFDNEGEEGDIAVWKRGSYAGTRENNIDVSNDEMLGGGSHNWEKSGVQGYTSNPGLGDDTSDEARAEAIQNAIADAVTFIQYNVADAFGAMQSNGIIYLGRTKAAFEIKKVDSKTKENLEGIEFELSKEDSTNVQTVKTAANGTILFGNLAPGTYTLKEKSFKAGYKKLSDDKNKWTVKVDSDGNIEVRDADGNVMTKDESTLYYYMIENEPIEVKISKTDINGTKEIAGATLRIVDKDGNEVANWVSEEGKTHTVEYLLPGEYTLIEETAPNGYLVAESIKFEILEDGTLADGSSKIVMKDDHTKITISKQDITSGKEIAGATLQVIDKDGNVIEEWVSEADKSHYINAKLVAGETYTLREITSPKGYLVAEDIQFTVGDDGVEQVIIMKDAHEEEDDLTADSGKEEKEVKKEYKDETENVVVKTADNGNPPAAASVRSVNTGDTTHAGIFGALMGFAAAGLFAIRRRRSAGR